MFHIKAGGLLNPSPAGRDDDLQVGLYSWLSDGDGRRKADTLQFSFLLVSTKHGGWMDSSDGTGCLLSCVALVSPHEVGVPTIRQPVGRVDVCVCV